MFDIVKKILLVILLGISAVFTFGVLLWVSEYIGLHPKDYFFPQDFNSDIWKESYSVYESRLSKNEYDGNNLFTSFKPRKRMVYSLIRQSILEGKSKSEIQSLLGLDSNDYNSNKWNYWLNLTVTDTRWLAVEFTENKVTDIYLWED